MALRQDSALGALLKTVLGMLPELSKEHATKSAAAALRQQQQPPALPVAQSGGQGPPPAAGGAAAAGTGTAAASGSGEPPATLQAPAGIGPTGAITVGTTVPALQPPAGLSTATVEEVADDDDMEAVKEAKQRRLAPEGDEDRDRERSPRGLRKPADGATLLRMPADQFQAMLAADGPADKTA